MTLKEALNRQFQNPEQAAQNLPLEKFHALFSAACQYQEVVIQRGLDIHDQAGVRPLLEGLQRDFIKPPHPAYAMIKEYDEKDGSISLGIDWNYEKDKTGRVQGRYKSVKVSAYPLTEDLLVSGRDCLLIPKSLWSDPNNTLLEDAILKAYQNPSEEICGWDGFLDLD